MAVEKLKKARADLAGNVSDATLKDLVDKVFEDGILTESEKDELAEKYPVKKDRMRDLIGMMLKKGDNSCAKFLDHLKKIDPYLYNNTPTLKGPNGSSQPAPIIPGGGVNPRNDFN